MGASPQVIEKFGKIMDFELSCATCTNTCDGLSDVSLQTPPYISWKCSECGTYHLGVAEDETHQQWIAAEDDPSFLQKLLLDLGSTRPLYNKAKRIHGEEVRLDGKAPLFEKEG